MKKVQNIIFWVLCIIIASACNNRLQDLKKNGIKARGVIMSGTKTIREKTLVSDASQKFSLHVVFYTPMGERIEVPQKLVDSITFNSSYNGKNVNIVYNPKNPKDFEIISAANAKHLEDTQQRKMTLDDLAHLFKQDNRNYADVLAHLEKIQYGWSQTQNMYQRASRARANEIVLSNDDQIAELNIIPHKFIRYASTNNDVCRELKRRDDYPKKRITTRIREKLPWDMYEFKYYFVWKDFLIFFREELEQEDMHKLIHQVVIMRRAKTQNGEENEQDTEIN
jgi:uncharacterized lipoprotein YehR (DUF1307 family)